MLVPQSFRERTPHGRRPAQSLASRPARSMPARMPTRPPARRSYRSTPRRRSRRKRPGRHKGYEYARSGNPTRTALETCLAALEGSERALAFASGLAATTAVLSTLRPGDEVAAAADLYGGTFRLLERVFKPWGLIPRYTEDPSPEGFAAILSPATKLVWIETPTNPLLQIVDIAAIAALAHSQGALLAVDNTFASPYLQRPIEQGADLVVHSTTKYLGGHSDVIGGAVAGSRGLLEPIAFYQNAAGAVPGPFDSWLVLRGIKTLAVRMERHCENARIARRVAGRAATGGTCLLSRPGRPSQPRRGPPPDARFRRHDQRSAEGRRRGRPAASDPHAAVQPGREPGGRRVVDRSSGDHDACEHPGRNPGGPRRRRRPGSARVGIEDVEDCARDLEQAIASRA